MLNRGTAFMVLFACGLFSLIALAAHFSGTTDSLGDYLVSLVILAGGIAVIDALTPRRS